MFDWRKIPPNLDILGKYKEKTNIQFTSENCLSRVWVTLVLIYIIPAFWNPVASSTLDLDYCSIWYYSNIATIKGVCITNSFWPFVVIWTLADEVSRLVHKIFSFVFLKTTLLVFCHILTSRFVKINALWVRNFVTSIAIVYTFSFLGAMEPFPSYGWRRILLIMNVFYLKSSHDLKNRASNWLTNTFSFSCICVFTWWVVCYSIDVFCYLICLHTAVTVIKATIGTNHRIYHKN